MLILVVLAYLSGVKIVDSYTNKRIFLRDENGKFIRDIDGSLVRKEEYIVK